MTTSDAELAALFLEFSRNKLFNQYWPRLRICVEPLPDEQFQIKMPDGIKVQTLE